MSKISPDGSVKTDIFSDFSIFNFKNIYIGQYAAKINKGSNNLIIGNNAGKIGIGLNNSIFIGANAGSEFLERDRVISIGDIQVTNNKIDTDSINIGYNIRNNSNGIVITNDKQHPQLFINSNGSLDIGIFNQGISETSIGSYNSNSKASITIGNSNISTVNNSIVIGNSIRNDKFSLNIDDVLCADDKGVYIACGIYKDLPIILGSSSNLFRSDNLDMGNNFITSVFKINNDNNTSISFITNTNQNIIYNLPFAPIYEYSFLSTDTYGNLEWVEMNKASITDINTTAHIICSNLESANLIGDGSLITTININDNTTDNLKEGITNLYLNIQSISKIFYSYIQLLSTDDIQDGSNNNYFDIYKYSSNFYSNISNLITTDSILGNRYYSSNDYYSNSSNYLKELETDYIKEGISNLYFNPSNLTSDFITQGLSNFYYNENLIKINISNTDVIKEGQSNLYFTNSKINSNIRMINTNFLKQGTSNLYATDYNIYTYLNSNLPTTDSLTQGTSNDYFCNINNKDKYPFVTDNIREGSNVYYKTPNQITGIISYNTNTDLYKEGTSNLYYYENRGIGDFVKEITSTITTDNINDGISKKIIKNNFYNNDLEITGFLKTTNVNDGISKKFIKNNFYNNDLEITGFLKATNVNDLDKENLRNNLEPKIGPLTEVFQVYDFERLSVAGRLSNIEIGYTSIDNSTDIKVPFIVIDNKIGINNSNPQYQLDVNGSIHCSNLLINNNSISDTYYTKSQLLNISNQLYNTISTSEGRVIDSTQFLTIIDASNNFITSNIFNSTGGNKWSINETDVYNNNQGNVGIGTSLPLSKLDVNGDINFTSNLKFNNSIIPFSFIYTTNIIALNGIFYNTSDDYGYFSFSSNGTITFPETTVCDILIIDTKNNITLNNYQSCNFNIGTYDINFERCNNFIISKITSNVTTIISDSSIPNNNISATIISTLNLNTNSNFNITKISTLYINDLNISNINPGSYNYINNFNNLVITGNNYTITTNNNSYYILKDGNGIPINPLVWYKFDDSINGMLLNSGTVGCNLIKSDNPTFDTTNYMKGNGSIFLNNTSTSSPQQHVIIPNNSFSPSFLNTINNDNGLSLSFWIKLSSSSIIYNRLIYLGNYTGSPHFYGNDYLSISTGDPIGNFSHFYIVSSTGGGSFFYYANIYDNIWKHIVWTISPQGYWNIYINNQLICNNQLKCVFPVLSSTNLAYVIGSDKHDENYGIKGNIDDFRIYDKVLTSYEVSQLYSGFRIDIYSESKNVIIKVPLNIKKIRFDGYINSSNVINQLYNNLNVGLLPNIYVTSNVLSNTSNQLVNYNNLINKPDIFTKTQTSNIFITSNVLSTTSNQLYNNLNVSLLSNIFITSNVLSNTSNQLINYNNLINKPDIFTKTQTSNIFITSNVLSITSNQLYNNLNVGILSNIFITSNVLSNTSNQLVNYNNLINIPDIFTKTQTSNIFITSNVLSFTSNQLYNTISTFEGRVIDLTQYLTITDGLNFLSNTSNQLYNNPNVGLLSNIFITSNVLSNTSNQLYNNQNIGLLSSNINVTSINSTDYKFSNISLFQYSPLSYPTFTNGIRTNIDDNNYYIQFTSNGTITIPNYMTCDCLVVGAGGRGGTGNFAGGGGSGEVVYYPSLTLLSGIYNISVGVDSSTTTNRISKLTIGTTNIITAQGGGDGGLNMDFYYTSNQIIIPINCFGKFNEEPLLIAIQPSTYNITFTPSNGTITLLNINTGSSRIDNSYPVIRDTTNGTNINPTAWYKFDISSNIGLDSLGSYNLTNVNGTTTTTGLKGSLCAVFNGTTQYLQTTAGVNLTSRSFSICCWAYPTNLSGNNVIYGWNGDASNPADIDKFLHFGYRSSSVFMFAFFYDDLDVPTTNDLNTWVHWVGVYNHTNRTQSVYKNGVIQNPSPRTIIGTNGLIPPVNNYNLGRGPGNARYFAGRVDDFRIYENKVLSEYEIGEIYKGRFTFYQDVTNGGSGVGKFQIDLLDIERRFPSKAYNSVSSQITTTLNGVSCLNTTITLTTADITYGSGNYECYVSSQNTTSFLPHQPYNWIVISTSGSDQWASPAGLYSATAPFSYTGTKYLGETGYKGEFIAIKMPVPIALTSYTIYRVQATNQRLRAPKTFKIYGSNDGNNWVEIQSVSDATYNAYDQYINTDLSSNTTTYLYYGMVVNQIIGSETLVQFTEWIINGKPLLIGSTNPNSGGSGGGGAGFATYSQYIQNGAVAGTPFNPIYSKLTAGNNGTSTNGGDGGSATLSGRYETNITGLLTSYGGGGIGATSNSSPSIRTNFGDGGDGNGGVGYNGIVILRFSGTFITKFLEYTNWNKLLNVNVGDGLTLDNVNNNLISSVWTKTENNIYNNNIGNVGIGTNNPNSILHLHNSNVSGEVRISLTDGNSGITTNDGFAIIKDANENCLITNYENTYLAISTNNTERMRINNSGNVGIGTTNPTYKLYVAGNVGVSGTVTQGFSDIRLKNKIGIINKPFSIINNLEGFYYKPNDLAVSFGFDSNNREVGLNALDAAKIIPEVVSLAPFDIDENKQSKSGENYLTISYEKLVPVLLEGLKELKKEVEYLKNKLKYR